MGANTLIPYLWAATGLVSLFAIVLAIWWAYAHGQFDEDIKNQMFSAGDDDRYGSPEPRPPPPIVNLRAGEWVVIAGTVLIVSFAVLVGTLIWLKPPPARYAFAGSAAAEQGEAIYRREACRDCHKVFGNGSSSGPALDGIGSRRSPDWLLAYLVDPKPGAGERRYRVSMPSYRGLKADEREALVAYLRALADPVAQRGDSEQRAAAAQRQ